MKVLVVADLHVSDRREFSAPTTWRGIAMGSRLARQLDALVSIFEMAAARAVDHVIVLGDVFDTAYRGVVPTSVITGLREAFDDCAVPITVIRGNHDGHSPHDPDVLSLVVNTLCEPLPDRPRNFVVWDSPVSVGGCRFVPYAQGETIARWAQYEADGPDKILFVHADIEGAVIGGDEFVAPSGLSPSAVSGYRLVVAGHIHRRQRLGNVQVVGPPWQSNFGETDFETGVMILDTATAEIEFLPVVSPKFVTVDADDAFDFEDAVDRARAVAARGDFVRFRVAADAVVPDFGALPIRVERAPAPSADGEARAAAGAPIEDVIGRYVAETAQGIDEAAVVAEALVAFDIARAQNPMIEFPKRGRA